MSKTLPKYTKNKMKGNIGESIAQLILSKFALVHKIDGSNDVGNDFICELIRNEYPTNLLFYVQVKYTQSPPTIKSSTLTYWRGSPIPVYLFWISDRSPVSPLNPQSSPEELIRETKCEYKRYTRLLHKKKGRDEEEPFSSFDRRNFLNNLLDDYSEIQYSKGFTPILKPRDFLTMDDKLNLGLPRYRLDIKSIARDHSRRIITNGWISLYSLAAAFMTRPNSSANKKRVCELLGMAKNLVTAKDRKDYTELVEKLESLYVEWKN